MATISSMTSCPVQRLTTRPDHAMSFLAFLFAATLLAVTPGPGIAYVVARTVAGGRTEGLASCVGTGIGGMLHVAAASLGLSALVAQSAVAFALVKVVGVAYLGYLGLRLLLRKEAPVAIERLDRQGARRALWEGVVVEALNVKTALFFLAFLPQFVAPAHPMVPRLILLGSICVVLNTLVDVVAVLGSDRLLASGPTRYARAQLLARISGSTMLALAGYLALARRP
jgi:threonine/homoserine/homoserine lactone efflux protein